MTSFKLKCVEWLIKIFAALVLSFLGLHLLAILFAAFHILWFAQAVAWGDLILLILFILCLPLIGFLMFWGFIVAIIGAGVRLGMGGRR